MSQTEQPRCRAEMAELLSRVARLIYADCGVDLNNWHIALDDVHVFLYDELHRLRDADERGIPL